MVFDYVGHVANTLLGFYQRGYSAEWDDVLSRLLDSQEAWEFAHVGEYCLTIVTGGDCYDIWINNRWYAYGHLQKLNGDDVQLPFQYRPSFRTMRRLAAFVDWYQNGADAGLQRRVNRFYGSLNNGQ